MVYYELLILRLRLGIPIDIRIKLLQTLLDLLTIASYMANAQRPKIPIIWLIIELIIEVEHFVLAGTIHPQVGMVEV